MSQSLHDIATLRLAWEEALRVRGCPPEALLLNDPIPETLARHLQTCPWCPDEREALKAAGSPIPELRALSMSAAVEVSEIPKPGDLVLLRSDLSDWGPKGRFYNAPPVVVLESLEESSSAFRVALVHDFPDLAGPGDVEVAPGVFAESWNTFACHRSHMGRRILTVPERVFHLVKHNSGAWPASFPAGIPDQSPEASFISAFRRLEVEVASYFAQRALEDLMVFQGDSERSGLESFLGDPQVFHQAFARWLQLDSRAEPSLKTLLTAPWTEDHLPLAAAAEETFPLRIVRFGEAPPVLEAATAEITVFQRTAQGFLVGGKVHKDLSDAAEIHAVWMISGRDIWPQETSLDTKTGYFRLLFPRFRKSPDSLKGLHILVADR